MFVVVVVVVRGSILASLICMSYIYGEIRSLVGCVWLKAKGKQVMIVMWKSFFLFVCCPFGCVQ